MIKLLTVIGARPQIIKAAALSRAVRKYAHQVTEALLHTGQHYDANMSQVFFDELQIPAPTFQLQTGGGSHGEQTAQMIQGIERVLNEYNPHAVVVYGDTNSTLAAAIAASKLHITLIHIEAGLRSFNKTMPEEVNRILCDHVSTFMYVPTHQGIDNLAREGFNIDYTGIPSPDKPRIRHTGDVMYDNSMYFAKLAQAQSTILVRLQLKQNAFVLATLHRNQNTDSAERLSSIFKMLLHLVERNGQHVVLPLHPRTRKMMPQLLDADLQHKIESTTSLIIIDPVSYLDMIQLEQHCNLICTDSGGVQKEAYFFKKPCIIFRPQTEWVELIELKKAFIVDANFKRFCEVCAVLSEDSNQHWPQLYGNGQAAEYILQDFLSVVA